MPILMKGGKHMQEDNEQKVTLEVIRSELQKEKIEDLEQFKSIFEQFHKELKNEVKEFIKYLEWAYEKSGNNEEIKKILEYWSGQNASDLIESLKRLGFSLKKDLGEYFEKSGYRLLEQTRSGKRSDVMYGITRIFITNKQKMRDDLIEAFKPYYSDELFKCFIFTFLGSAIKPKEND